MSQPPPPPPNPNSKVKVFDSTMIVSALVLLIVLFLWITQIQPWLAKKNAPQPVAAPTAGGPSLHTAQNPHSSESAGPNGSPTTTSGTTPLPPTGPIAGPAIGPIAGPAGPVAVPAGPTGPNPLPGGPTADRTIGATARLIDVSAQPGADGTPRVRAVISTTGGALRVYEIAEPRPLAGGDTRLTILDALQRKPYDRMSLAVAEVDYKLGASENWQTIPDFDQRVYSVVQAAGKDIEKTQYHGKEAQVVTLESKTDLFTLQRKFIFFEGGAEGQPDHLDTEISITAASTSAPLFVEYKLRGPSGIVPDGPKEEPVSKYSSSLGRAFTRTSTGGSETVRKMTHAQLTDMMAAKNSENLTSGELNHWTGIQNRFFSAILIPYEPQRDLQHPELVFVFYAEPIPPEWLYDDPDNPRYGGMSGPPEKRVVAFHILEAEVGVIRDHELAAGATRTDRYALYAGPSAYGQLKAYDSMLTTRPEGLLADQSLELDHNIEYSSFSWLDYFSRFLVWFLGGLHYVTHSFGLSVILLTVLVKLAMFPVSRKSVLSMEKMKLLAPFVAALKKVYEGKDDAASKQKMSAEMMALYKMNGTSPFSSCGPMFFTIPVFLALYDAFWANYDMRHMGFLGVVHDLCEPDHLFPIYLDNLWSALPHYFNLLPVLYLGLTYVQQGMMPQAPTDPNAPQMKYMTKLMPLFMFYIFYAMPAGLVLYFTASSLYSILENKVIRNYMYKPAPVEAPAHLKKMVEKMAAEQKGMVQAKSLGLAAQG